MEKKVFIKSQMAKFSFLLLGILFSCSVVFLTAQEKSGYYIQWEKVPHADFYEIMLYSRNPDKEPRMIMANEESMVIPITEGYELVKIRSVRKKEKGRTYSQWSAPVVLPEPPRPPENQKKTVKKKPPKVVYKENNPLDKVTDPRYRQYMLPQTNLFILPAFSYRNGYWVRANTVIRLETKSSISKSNTIYYCFCPKKSAGTKPFKKLSSRTLSQDLFKNVEGEFLLRYYSIDEYGNKGSLTETVLYVDTLPPRIRTESIGDGIVVHIEDYSSSLTGDIRDGNNRVLKTIYAPGKTTIPLSGEGGVIIRVTDSLENPATFTHSP